ncbi:MAG TPA: transposase [Candidatus Tectomicrobia bacterium]
MWHPPIALTLEEQKIAARTRKARKFLVFLRERRHELLDATFQDTLAETYRAEPGGKEPVEAGMLALATLLQAYCHVGDRDAVELTVMDKRWQMVLDCLGAEQPPFSQGTLWNFRMRLIAHNLGCQAFLAENLLCALQPLTLLSFRQWMIKKGVSNRPYFGL